MSTAHLFNLSPFLSLQFLSFLPSLHSCFLYYKRIFQLPSELSQERVPAPLSAPIQLPELHNGATPRVRKKFAIVPQYSHISATKPVQASFTALMCVQLMLLGVQEVVSFLATRFRKMDKTLWTYFSERSGSISEK